MTNEAPAEIETTENEFPVRPWIEFRDSGLLMLVNRCVFHPRGYAMYVEEDGTGWNLMGDGTEPWTFGAPDPETENRMNDLFSKIKELMP